MKRLLLFILLSVLLTNTVSADGAEDKKMDSLINQIDQIDNNSKRENEKLDSAIASLENRLSTFAEKIASIQSTKDSVDAKYKEVLQIAANFKELEDKLSKISAQSETLNAKINAIEKDQARMEGDMSSSQNIVTWVTLIVSVLVIMIGLFFSKLFLDLYSNYHVLRSHMPTTTSIDLASAHDNNQTL